METFDSHRNIGWLIYDVSRLMQRAFDRRVRGHGITRQQWRVLAELYRSDGCTQTKLAEVLEVEKAPLGRLLDKLEERGWVERRPDPADRRAKRIYLSGDSDTSAMVETMRRHAVELFEEVYAGLSVGDMKELERLLGLLKSNLAIGEASAGDDTDMRVSEDRATLAENG